MSSQRIALFLLLVFMFSAVESLIPPATEYYPETTTTKLNVSWGCANLTFECPQFSSCRPNTFNEWTCICDFGFVANEGKLSCDLVPCSSAADCSGGDARCDLKNGAKYGQCICPYFIDLTSNDYCEKFPHPPMFSTSFIVAMVFLSFAFFFGPIILLLLLIACCCCFFNWREGKKRKITRTENTAPISVISGSSFDTNIVDNHGENEESNDPPPSYQSITKENYTNVHYTK